MKNWMTPLHTLCFISFALPFITLAQTPFSQDSAVAFLKTISVEIGPRPMGSPNERRAMEFAVERFRRFGLQEAYIMPMMSVEGDAPAGSTNTNSGIAVGVLKGTSDRIIVIGGHIDSAGPDIPGTNDDGSGSATVIELARVLSQRKNESTLVFCLFGGEESGLRGSKHFVNQFGKLDKVVLMLQIDMTNGSDWLVPLIDARGKNAPKWLVSAAYEEFEKLGYNGLSYPTNFFTLNNSLPGGGIGSDHMPFLEKNIPAIDFTSDITDPIHSPQDNFENFKVAGLKRSGDLVYRLVERFDGGVPEQKAESYYLVQIGSFLLFVPLWLVSAFNVIAILVAAFSLYQTRKARFEVDRNSRPKIPGLKLFLILLIIQTFVWSSELVVGLLKGTRYPWFSDPQGYFILAGLAATIGIWVGLQMAPRLGLSRDPYRYFLRTTLWLGSFVLLFSFSSSKLAFYPSVALLCTSLAFLAKKTGVKVFLWLISPYLMYRLFFNEGFFLLARTVPEGTMTTGLGFSVFWHVLLIVFFSLWSYPSFLGFAGLYSGASGDLFWLRAFKQRMGIMLAGLGFFACTLWLSSRPSYTDLWKQAIRVNGEYDLKSAKGRFFVRSSDYLDGTSVKSGSVDTVFSWWIRESKIPGTDSLAEPWINITRKIRTTKVDSSTRFDVLTNITLKHRPLSITLTYSSSKRQLRDASSGLTATMTPRTISLRWSAFPGAIILAPVQFTVVGADSVTESIEATFVEPPVPLRVEKQMSIVSFRTIVRSSAILNAAGFAKE